ncbi:glucokinase [Deinobacterium chartae]|uniref:Glucokinase n=1 Tax=Deinobacterium chartae TaxID=521158 RepID=A0A841HZ42_9DEIO|nr:ROK family protein [Deinobacterium chartae]MBB6098801.1 glucokinase [Deinobacterium chartae]
MSQTLVGVDLGGTKIAVAGLLDGRIVNKLVEPTPKAGWQSVLDQMAVQVQEVLRELPGVQRIGVGVPGPLDFKNGVVKFAPNIYGFDHVPLVSYLQDKLGLPVVMENDANAAALGEFVYGAAQDAESAIYVTISTGIGGGIVFDGRVWRGANGIAGEIGHMIALPGATVSGAGQAGGLEALASGTAIARDASYAIGRKVTTAEAFQLAQDGHKVARAIVENAMRYIGIALADLQKSFDPEVFVLGGGVAEVGEYFFRHVQAAADEYAAGFAPVVIRKAVLGVNAGVIGAALAAR